MKKKLIVGILVLTMLVACIGVTALATSSSAELIDDVDALTAAVAKGGTVKLDGDIQLVTSVLEINPTKDLTLDLNGHILTGPTDQATLVIGDKDGPDTKKVTVTITNSGTAGKITGNTTRHPVIAVKPGITLILDKVTVEQLSTSNTHVAVSLDTGSEENSAKVEVNSGTVIKGARVGIGVYAYGNLTVNGGEISGRGFGIATSGKTTEGPNAVVTVKGGTISNTATDQGAAMYLPSNGGKTTITGGTIKGYYGIVVRGGTIDVSGTASVTATGKNPGKIGDAGSATLPVAALVVDKDTDYGTSGSVSANITGGTFTAEESTANAVVYAQDGVEQATPSENLSITGGTFTAKSAEGKTVADADVGKLLPAGSALDTTGKLGADPEQKANIVATVGDASYTSLADAFKYAPEGAVIKIVKDEVELPYGTAGADRIEVNKKVTLDINGKKLTRATAVPDDTAALKVEADGDLTIKNGTITGSVSLLLVEGKLTVENSVKVIQTAKKNPSTSYVANHTAVAVGNTSSGGGTLIFKGKIVAAENGIGTFGQGEATINGDIEAKYFAVATNGNDSPNGKITIEGGTIKSTDSAAVYLPNGELTVEDGSIEGKAGIVARGGKLTVEDGTITATGEEDLIVGDATKGGEKYAVPPAAVVVDKPSTSSGYPEPGKTDHETELKGGTFTAKTGDAVTYTEDGDDPATAVPENALTVKGGSYSSSVDEELVSDELKAELVGSNGMYSYYPSAAAALAADPAGKVNLLHDAEKSPYASNITFTGATATITIKEPTTNTTENKYYVRVYKGEKKTSAMTEANAVATGISATALITGNTVSVDFSKLDGGVYTIEVYSLTDATKKEVPEKDASNGTFVDTIPLTFYKVTYEASTGVHGEDEYFCSTVKAEFEAKKELEYAPSSFRLDSGVNKWSYGFQDVDTYNYIVRIGGEYSAPIDPGHKCPTKGFKDMEILDTSKLWYHEAMDYMVLNGYINGFPGNTLQPNGVSTRAQLWVIMAQTKGVEVKSDPWYKLAKKWAEENKYSDGLRPDDPIQREEIVAILWRMADEPKSTKSLSDYKFGDAASVNDWAKTAMAWAVEKGIISGRTDDNGKPVLVPQGIATRAELAVLIYNYVTLMK